MHSVPTPAASENGRPGAPLDGAGTYVLLIHLPCEARITVGRLGTFPLVRGWYLYAGSALGRGGLRARLARHRRRAKRLHWHIDYLLLRARLVVSWEAAYAGRLECAWHAALLGLPGARLPIFGFGASDCTCTAHLTWLPSRPDDAVVRRALAAASPVGVHVHVTTYVTCTGD
jgi:Uri superfamily endonuclease